MGNFKVGDIVVGNQDNKVNLVVEGQLYEVLAVDVGSGFEYIKTDLNPNNWVRSERFYLYKPAPQVQQDDPLPPAPESGLYFNHDGTRSASLELAEGVIALGTNASIPKVRLTPETALDLAYDLRRMAMEIKRKEKQV